MTKTAAPEFDSLVVITVFTTSPSRRDEIDQLIDKAFRGEPGVQVARVVGYPSLPEIERLTAGAMAVETEPSTT